MTTIVALVEDERVEELTENFIANGWGENYSLIDRNFVSDERIYAAPIPNAVMMIVRASFRQASTRAS